MTVFFLHIPKTAGTSVSHALRSTLQWDAHLFVRDPAHVKGLVSARGEEREDGYHLIHGHYHYGFVEAFCRASGRERFVMTVLREPIARVLSAYGFVSERYGAELGEIGRAAWGVVDHMRSTANDNWFFADNLLVRFLIRKWKDKGDPCTRADLAEAKAVLLEKIQLVGFVEQLDYFEEAVATLYDVDLKRHVYNRSLRSLRPEDVPAADLRVLRDENALDIELYDWALGQREHFRASGLAAVEAYRKACPQAQIKVGPGDDGLYLTTQNAFDEMIARINELHQEAEARRPLIESMKAFITQAEVHLKSATDEINAVGGEINGLLNVSTDVEKRLVDANAVIDGRKAFAAELKTRLARLLGQLPPRVEEEALSRLAAGGLSIEDIRSRIRREAGLREAECATLESELAEAERSVESLRQERGAAEQKARGLKDRLDALGGEGLMLKAQAEELLRQAQERTDLAEDRVQKYATLKALLKELR